jgi:integrase
MYLKQIKNGGRSTYTGKNFAPGTIVAISVSLNRLADFEKQKRHVYDFDEIDMTFYRDFTAFLKKRQYALNSIGKTVKVIKTVMRCAEEEGYHNNHSYMAHSFKAPKADADAIYLTKEDLDKINALDLSKECWGMQVARDIFMIGVWTAQRVSDYNNIRKEDVKTETIRSWDEDGNLSERQVRTIHVVQQKTGKKVVIPCNKALRDILDKYPDELPHISEQKLNLYLKELGKKAELNEMVDIRSTKGGEMKVEPVAKHDLIHTHTARRTGATLMYLSGMNVYDICKITGHSNIKTLERYIKANELETVKKITEAYDYFK